MTNTIMAYSTLDEFLKNHKATTGLSGSNSTHARIPGGKFSFENDSFSYFIPPSDLSMFYRLYFENTFKHGKPNHLTEKQVQNGVSGPHGPIAVDIDFRYEYSVCEHLYQEGHITDIVDLYLSEIKELLEIEENSTISVFVMEKQHVNRVESKQETKDGIHIIFGVQMDHTMQLMLREKILMKIPEICGDIPITNTWETVLDKGISEGNTNWQLYGSKKPNHLAALPCNAK